jgi:hypothetical protein
VRKERVALKDVADAARLGRKIDTSRTIEEDPAVHDDASGVRGGQSGQALKREGLARP